MKARIKSTGVVVEVQECDTIHKGMGYDYVSVHNGYVYKAEDLEIELDPGYWARLEHQYAGMAMQGMLNNSLLITGLLKVNKSHEDIVDEVTGTAVRYAHALVEKLKKEERK